MKTMICASLCIAAGLSSNALATAQGPALPKWKISEICAKESAPGQCAAFEGVALKSVSSSWQFVLDDIKQACLAQLSNPLDQNWRELANCVNNANTRALDRFAVKTARTPGEPVPPPRVEVPTLAADLAPREPAAAAPPAAAVSTPPQQPAQPTPGETKQ